MKDVVTVHFFMDRETSFSIQPFQLPTLGFHKTEIRGEPWSGDRERDSPSF